MPTLKITGVDEAIVRFVASRSKALHFKGQAEYLRSLVREDMARAQREVKQMTPQEKAEAWRAGSGKFPNAPLLSEEAISRESIYGNQG